MFGEVEFKRMIKELVKGEGVQKMLLIAVDKYTKSLNAEKPDVSRRSSIHAELKPLDGKYYGTIVELSFDDGGHKEQIKLWDSGDYTPSKRELEECGYTEMQWAGNELVDNGWNGKSPIYEMDLTVDGHFESKITYERALMIVSLLNGAPELLTTK